MLVKGLCHWRLPTWIISILKRLSHNTSTGYLTASQFWELGQEMWAHLRLQPSSAIGPGKKQPWAVNKRAGPCANKALLRKTDGGPDLLAATVVSRQTPGLANVTSGC